MPLFASHQLCFTGGRLLVGKYVIYLHEWLYIKSVRVNRTFAKLVEEVNHKLNRLSNEFITSRKPRRLRNLPISTFI